MQICVADQEQTVLIVLFFESARSWIKLRKQLYFTVLHHPLLFNPPLNVYKLLHKRDTNIDASDHQCSVAVYMNTVFFSFKSCCVCFFPLVSKFELTNCLSTAFLLSANFKDPIPHWLTTWKMHNRKINTSFFFTLSVTFGTVMPSGPYKVLPCQHTLGLALIN